MKKLTPAQKSAFVMLSERWGTAYQLGEDGFVLDQLVDKGFVERRHLSAWYSDASYRLSPEGATVKALLEDD